MKWLKKLEASLQERDQKNRDKATYQKYRNIGLAKQCAECGWFFYRTEKPRNWVCRCPDSEMRFIGNTCLGWKLGSHPEMVIYGSR